MSSEIPSPNPEKQNQLNQPKAPPKSAEELLQEAADRKKIDQAGDSEGKLIKFFEECTKKGGNDIEQNICLFVNTIDVHQQLILMLLGDKISQVTNGQINEQTSQELNSILNTCENPQLQAEKILQLLIPLIGPDDQQNFLDIPDLPDNWRKIIAKEISDSKK